MPYGSVVERADVANLISTEVTHELLGLIEEKSHTLSKMRELQRMARYQKTMPVLSALAYAYFVSGETGLKQTTELNWEDVTITAEEVAVIIPIAQQTLDDIEMDIWGACKKELTTALGVCIDNAILHGTNAPASWPTDICAGAIAAGNTVAYGTGEDLYDDVMTETGTLTLVEQDGYEVNGHLARLNIKGILRGLRDSDGQLIFGQNMQEESRYYLDGQKLTFPKSGILPATRLLVSGDWDAAVYSLRQDMNWTLADQAVITDAQGNIIFNFFQQDMVGLRVTMRLGWALPNPINRANITAATRHPFAVLTT